MNKLFINGCSITLGAELGEEKPSLELSLMKTQDGSTHETNFRYRHENRYSTLVANSFGMEPINISRTLV